MKTNDAIAKLKDAGQQGMQVLSRADLATLLGFDHSNRLGRLLRILVEAAALERVAKGVYVNHLATPRRGYLIEEIACVLRREETNYVSLESILSEFGVISQIMISRITVMTTGRGGIFETPYGTIEFTHTKRRPEAVLARTVDMPGRPLRIATKKTGVADLRRVGRNTYMINPDELESDEIGR